ncbi:MAG: iron-containing alcohol dehydrogenase [Rikenellaceae bacterium]|nr:iron-containing alcohol dehydrogenase [Rikenellaceae bacterium]MCL2692409.1 iron-containing alcohol dehydrogenase [Rikenellaceae bacterium]
MKNFIFQNPTKLVFGKGQIAKLAQLIPADARLMITFGGGSVRKNGVYDQVKKALEGRVYTEFWGIEPNPTVETLSKAITQGKAEGVNFILAVGGGSVLDGTKLIAAGILYEGDAWDIVKRSTAERSIPYASVMTLPATGSEMNSGAVISRAETHEKYAFYTRYPEFSVLDPETTFSLPPEQIAAGLADVYVHVMEQYLTTTGQSRVMDRWAEGLLLTVLEIAPLIRKNQHDYDVMADFMLSATLALNDFIRMGVTQDWATHMIGHELTALHGITHGASLAIVLPGTMSVLREQKHGKLLQYASRVFGLNTGGEDERIEEAIKRTEEFFRSLGLATRLSEAGIGEETIEEIVERFNARGARLGEAGNVTGDVVREILKSRK